MKYTKEKIIEQWSQKEKMKFLFFWGHTPAFDGTITKSCFSQWWDCSFTADGVEYHTAEQYMMYQKALLFSDKKTGEEIMAASHPKQYKTLGRKISGFDQRIWDKNCCDIVIKGNLAKFSQDESLKSFLLSTKDSVLAEASPYDRIWGIGMSADNKDCEDPTLWKGENLLGFCLMEVRDILRGL